MFCQEVSSFYFILFYFDLLNNNCVKIEINIPIKIDAIILII